MEQEKINKLLKLNELYEQGILSQEEMNAEKAKILGTDNPTKESEGTKPTNQNVDAPNTNDAVNTSLHSKQKNTNAIIGGVVLVAAIVGIVLFFVNRGKTKASSSLGDTSAVSQVMEEDPFFTYSDETSNDSEMESSGTMTNTEFIEWIKSTYGNDNYLSTNFKQIVRYCMEEEENTGYIVLPDFNWWWWNQDPMRKLEINYVEQADENEWFAEVVADGTILYLQIIKEDGNWVYDEFVDASQESYKQMMKMALLESKQNSIE